MADLKVRLIGEDGGMKAAVDGAARSIERYGATAKKSMQEAGSSASKFNATLSKLGIGLSAGAIAAFTRSSVQAFLDAEQSVNRLSAMLSVTSYSAGLTRVELEGLAQTLSKNTLIDDDQIRDGISQLLVFRNVVGDVAKQAVVLGANYSAAFGVQMSSAIESIGRALETPAEAARSLRALNVRLSGSQQDLIEKFVKSGEVAKAQAIIMGELEGKYAGLAEQINKGPYAESKKMTLAWNEMVEAFGKSPATTPVFEWMEQGFNDMKGYLNDPSISNFLALLTNNRTVDRSIVASPVASGLINRGDLPPGAAAMDREAGLAALGKRESGLERQREAERERDKERNKARQAQLKKQATEDVALAKRVFDESRTPQERFIENMSGIGRLYKSNKIDLDLYNRAALDYLDTLNKTDKDLQVAQKATEDWADAQAESAKSYLLVADSLYANEAAARKYVENYKALAGYLSGDELSAAAAALGKQFAESGDAAKESGEEVAQIYKDSASSIRGAFRDTFRDVFDSGVQGFKGMGSRMLDVFKDVVADMATLAIARPIILPIVSTMGGALGVSGSAQASVLQQLGGTGAVGNLGGLAGGLGAFGGGFGAGLSGGFGAASTAASGAAFSTMTGALSSIGAFAGAALPWVGGALLLNQVTGGGLFGTKSKVKDTGYELSLSGSDVSGRSYIDRERKKSMFRGTSRSTEYGAVDPALMAQLDATFAGINASIVSGAQGLGISTAKNFLDGFSSTSKVSGAGEEAIQKWVTSVTAEMYRGLLKSSGLSGLLRQFDTADATQVKVMGDAIFAIGKYLSANPIKDAAEAMRLASRTIKEQYDEQRAALMGLVRGYDGSIDATQKLAAATQERYQLEIQLLNQISAVRSGVKDLLGGSIEGIRQSTMAPSELYGYLTNRAETLAQQLGGATDPARIQQLSEQINALTNQAYGLVPDASRGTLGPQFIQFLEQVQGTADTRLSGMAQGVQDSQQQMARTVQDTMERVARRLEEVAQKQLEAAQATQRAAEEQMRSTNQTGFYRYG